MRSRTRAAAVAAALIAAALGVWTAAAALGTPGANGAEPAGSLVADGTPSDVDAQLPVVAAGEIASREVEPPAVGALVVTTAVPTLAVYDSPNGTAVETLSAWSTYGSPRTLLAVGDGTDAPGWIRVQLPNRAGHQYGWVREADVTTASTSTRVDVYLAEHELDISVDGSVVLSTTVAVGAPATPTPLGLFYVTDPIDLSASPGGVYGPYILGLSGYSEVLTRFNGGAPQLALHGTNRPGSIGSSVSNGCVRMPNDVAVQAAGLVGLGSPVLVHASREEP